MNLDCQVVKKLQGRRGVWVYVRYIGGFNWVYGIFTLKYGYLGRVLLESTVLGWLGWLGFFVFYWEKTVFGWLVDQLFQPNGN